MTTIDLKFVPGERVVYLGDNSVGTVKDISLERGIDDIRYCVAFDDFPSLGLLTYYGENLCLAQSIYPGDKVTLVNPHCIGTVEYVTKEAFKRRVVVRWNSSDRVDVCDESQLTKVLHGC